MELSGAPNLMIGLPQSGRPIDPDWPMGILQRWPMATRTTWYQIRGKEIGEARNLMAAKCLERGIEWLWFLDDDVVPKPDALRKLLYEMKHLNDSSIKAIGGIYFSKEDEPEPVVGRGNGQGCFWQWKVGDVFDCDWIGTGCLLIHTSIFRELKPPWFKTVDEENLQQTDDIFFCDKVRAKGYRILAHGGVLCTHWDVRIEQDQNTGEIKWVSKCYFMPKYAYMNRKDKPTNGDAELIEKDDGVNVCQTNQ